MLRRPKGLFFLLVFLIKSPNFLIYDDNTPKRVALVHIYGVSIVIKTYFMKRIVLIDDKHVDVSRAFTLGFSTDTLLYKMSDVLLFSEDMCNQIFSGLGKFWTQEILDILWGWIIRFMINLCKTPTIHTKSDQ